jgi:ketosteroid isomerase-like protein
MLNLRNEFMKKTIWLISAVVLASCQSQQNDSLAISKDEMLRIVKACGKQFSIGVQKKDSTILTNIYSDSAQYVQPKIPIIKGKTEIGKDWAAFIQKKEKPIDLVLNINDVRGNREIIYETGSGYTLLADSTKWDFNYVNVWRLQKDGSYKLEVDTYN